MPTPLPDIDTHIHRLLVMSTSKEYAQRVLVALVLVLGTSMDYVYKGKTRTAIGEMAHSNRGRAEKIEPGQSLDPDRMCLPSHYAEVAGAQNVDSENGAVCRGDYADDSEYHH